MSEKQTHPKDAADEEALLATLTALARRARIAPGAELGEVARKAQQKVQRLQRLEAKASFHEKVAIGNVAEELGLTGIPLSGVQLRGAILAIIKGVSNPANLAAFEAAGQAWLDSRRPAREPGTFRVFVTAATIGAELAQACSDRGLRRVPMPKGYKGRLALAPALELGRLYSATVHLEHKGEEHQLVDRGVVDAELLGKLKAEPGVEGPIAPIATEPKDIISGADALGSLSLGEAAAVAANANDDVAAPLQSEAAPDRHHQPIRSLHRPLSH
jgi:hypothetical protein